MKREIIVNWLSLESHLNDWVRTPHILDGKAGIPRWSLALNERRNLLQTCSMREKVPLNKKTKNDAHLRVRPQTSSAHLEDCPLVLHIVKGGGATVVGAARLAVRHHGAQLKLLQVLAGRAQQLCRVETPFKAPCILVSEVRAMNRLLPCSINCLSASSRGKCDKDLTEQQPPALHCEAAAANALK